MSIFWPILNFQAIEQLRIYQYVSFSHQARRKEVTEEIVTKFMTPRKLSCCQSITDVQISNCYLIFFQFWSCSPWAQTPWSQSQGVDFPLLVVRVLVACTQQTRRETFPFLAILKSPSNFLSRHNTEVSLSLFVDLINLVRLGTILTKILLERPYCLNFVFSTYITIISNISADKSRRTAKYVFV